MQRWEYGRLVYWRESNRKSGYKWRGQDIKVNTFDTYLNQLGSEGWEMVSSMVAWGGQGEEHYSYIFKRPA